MNTENDFYSDRELREHFGFRHLGHSVKISRLAAMFGTENMSIGDGTRIDCFCMLSAGSNPANPLAIGDRCHIACGVYLYGGEYGIEIGNLSGLSARTTVFSSSDDYRASALCTPLVPDEYRKLFHGKVVIGDHVMIGTNSILLPGTTVGECTTVAAFAVMRGQYEAGKVYGGNPLRVLRERDIDEMRRMEREFMGSLKA
jgi:dTDP-4-amino-4,6-dideoxy-D-glucose acyltransferase